MRTAIAMVLALFVGCATTAPRAGIDPSDAHVAGIDACAARLHELSGVLLLHYARHQRLPENVEALREFAQITDADEMSCPVSGRAYIYDPSRFELGGHRLVLYDAIAAHEDSRLAVTIDFQAGEEALVTRVIALPEALFRPAGR